MIDPSTALALKDFWKEKTVLPQDREPIRILIIPHQPNRNVKVRAMELARHLAAQPEYEVYVLVWRIRQEAHPTFWHKVGSKIHQAAESALLKPKIREEDGVHWVSIPHLMAPYGLSQSFNQRQVQRFVSTHRIDAVISGNAYHFPMPQAPPNLLRIYDVVDDHISPDSNPHWQRTRAFTLGELHKAAHALTISHALQAELSELGFSGTTLVPNGVDLAAFQRKNTQAIEKVQSRYGLNHRFTIGYIGNHGWWGGLDLLLSAFETLQQKVPESRLLIVGPGDDLEKYQHAQAHQPNVIFTGAVPPSEVAAYFHASNLGVLPFQPCPFTDNAMPLKILEYGAAQKRVIATPLKELVTLQFPHVRLIAPNAADWGEALIEEALHPTPWESSWDETIALYDWPRLWQPVDALLKSRFGVPDAVTV